MVGKLAWLACYLAASGLWVAPVLALERSVSEDGINALRLHKEPYNLTGRKIAIGQVEPGRPGKFGFDKVAAWNPPLNIAGVFYRNRLASANAHVDNHANMVANVMVSHDKRLPGVAPKARLYSSAVGSLKKIGQPEECLAVQHVALQNSGDIRAINLSFGESLQRDSRRDAKLDGNALLTQCIDWSARVHDVVYVVAGNQGKGGIPIPTDNFNGITTAYTAKKGTKFAKVDFPNLSALPLGIGRSLIEREINVGERRAIGLLAPGNKISVYNLQGKLMQPSGTSFAAPHITAAVALLQEYGDRIISAARQDSNWSIHSRKHQVMKAVLFNSADKIADVGDGLRLGMERTVLNKNNRTWLESDAYAHKRIPLDIQMGTGHLNVFRAYQQFSGGQWQPEGLVKAIGWDYRTIAAYTHKDYVLQQKLRQDSFVAVTLIWDRLVELKDLDRDGQYDIGENFRDRGLNNLDIYLMRVNENSAINSVCSSESKVDSVEHIFCRVPSTGRYKIRVDFHNLANEKVQPYALAWWTSAH